MFFMLMVGTPGSLTTPPIGAHHQHFFTLMVGAPGSPATPPKGRTIYVF
jgi:hypothetical protein